VRATVIGISFLAVVVLVPAGSIFGLNGGQWSWWRAASWAGALSFVVTAAAVAFPRNRTRSEDPGVKGLAAAGVLLGLAVIAISLIVMASRYSDPYSGPLLWPHALAVLSFAGLVVIELSMLTFVGRSVDSV
jgi:hypothetical protein